MDQKLLYTAPEVEPLVIRFEGMICQSSNETYNEKGMSGDWSLDD